MSAEAEVRGVLARIEAAWRQREFEGLERCFHENAVIVGSGHVEFARGRDRCAESYREFATNADVLNYTEEGHVLRVWGSVAIHAFGWRMTYRRKDGPTRERGTDQLVLERTPDGWQVVWRLIHFEADGV